MKIYLLVVQKVTWRVLKFAAGLAPILVKGLNIFFMCLTVFFLARALNLAVFHISSEEGSVIVQLGDLLFFDSSTFSTLFALIEIAYIFAAVLTLLLKDLKWTYRLFFFVVICAYPLLMSFLSCLRLQPGP